jgi:hypothetical protein
VNWVAMDVVRVQWRAVEKCVVELPGSIETSNLFALNNCHLWKAD